MVILLPACTSPPAATPGTLASAAALPAIEAATIPRSFQALGTEPFWSARVDGDTLTWSTPEQPDGQTVPITRKDAADMAIISTRVNGAILELEVRPATCSDGMSDRVYPLSVIRKLGPDRQQGCAR